MKISLFEYENYKAYFNAWLDDPDFGGGHGSRVKMALAMNCQKSYLALVLNGSAHFSLEQLEAANEFMGHTEQEGGYLLTLLLYQRAGSQGLRNRFKKRLVEILDSRLLLKNRLGIGQNLSSRYHATYYSSWYYAAIHVMISQEKYRTIKSMAERLGLEPTTVNSVLKFLLECRLIEKKDGKYMLGNNRIHLPSDSPFISRHHINWRIQAMKSMEKSKKANLHYSSVNTVSKSDALRIRELLTQAIEQAQKIIKESPEDEIQCLSVDFFEV